MTGSTIGGGATAAPTRDQGNFSHHIKGEDLSAAKVKGKYQTVNLRRTNPEIFQTTNFPKQIFQHQIFQQLQFPTVKISDRKLFQKVDIYFKH